MTIYKKYGKTFKKLRIQKNLKLSSFSHLGISPAALSKFENGKSMLKFDKLYLALSELSVTLSEYEKCLNDFDLALHEHLIRQTIIAQINNDKTEQYNCFLEAKEIKEEAYALAIKSYYSPLALTEKEFISNYFENINFWRYLDLYTFYLSLEQLRPLQIVYLLKSFFIEKQPNSTLNSLEHRIRFTHIVCKAVIHLCSKNHSKTAYHLLEYIHPEVFKHTMYTKNLYNLAKGYWISNFEEPSLGKKEILKALHHFKSLSAPGISEYYKRMISNSSNTYKN